MRIQRTRQNWFVILLVFALVFGITFLVQKNTNKNVEAANLGAFDPGYIISDFQMSNYTSMSEGQIQNFLKSMNSCNDYNTSKTGNNVGHLSESTPYSWHVKDGHYVCMADEDFNGESAAHIIWQAARDFRINPQVLIVLLQKEQGLVTDTFPNSVQYRSATGYGCPDTAACSSTYYGFKNQVRNAAEMFRSVLDGGWTNYPLGNNYVKYNPKAACGGSVVNIRNLATSALYRYTPYQPNAVTLAGGSDACSAYGNKNFYVYFEDWFGNIKWDGWPDLSVVISNNRVGKEDSDLNLTYRTHIEHYGWLNRVNGGEMAGTAGYAARVEALQVEMDNNLGGDIEYRTHVQGIGWMDWVKNGETSGTTGQSLRVEAVQLKLNGEISKIYDIYYRTHVQTIGWMDWVKNGETSGTTGQALRIEAIQIKLVKKNPGLGPDYSTHVQTIGWMDWVKNGETSGTTGQAKRVEAIEIKLPEALANQYDIYYRVHVQGIGWMDWVKNGETSGTTGQAKRVEAIEIMMVNK